MQIILFNKPFRVLTRFSRADGRATLADHLALPGVYPAGRLDYDSEGLLLLSDDGALRAAVTDPGHALEKVYWVQVEGIPDVAALAALARGVRLGDGPTRPARVRALPGPPVDWPRDPPIRHRAAIPTAWIELAIREGRNRQVRRMTAAVGHPTLRLVRAAIGPFGLDGLVPGAHRQVDPADAAAFRDALRGVSGRARAGLSASPPRAPARSSGAGRPSSGRPARGPRR
jgi:23S rRNA pseudouridine2457 synthase